MEGLTIVRNRWARFAGSGTMAAGLMAALCLVLLPGCPSGMTDACANDPCDDGDNCTVDTCTADDTTSVGFTCTNEPVDCADGGVCNPEDGECVECLDDADCDNGDFCDGSETCGADNTCAAGTAPCDEAAGEVCLEDTDTCGVGCVDDADCPDDGLFCTGTAVCDADTGACAESGSPCAAGEVCDESNDACVECLVDEDCGDNKTCNTNSFTCEGSSGAMCNSNGDCPDDGVFCNGVESCDTTGMTCVSSGDPCTAGQICNETTNMCDAMTGMTFTLTAETDTFVGTVNADTFDAPANTLGDNDILDGAGGPDTLNATLLGVDLTAGAETPTLVDIETMNVESRASANIFELQGQQPSLVNLTGNADFEWFDFDANQETTFNLNAFEDTFTLDFDDAGLDGMEDVLNLIFTNVGTDSADVVLEEGDGEDLEELNLTSMSGPNKVDLALSADVNLVDVTVAGDSDLTVEAQSDDLTGLDVDASSLGASFTVRADMDGGDALDLSGYTGLDMIDVFDGGGGDPTITLQEGAGVLFTETYDDPSIDVDGAGAAGENNNSQDVSLTGDADVDLDDFTINNVENITINSDTTDEADPEARANSIDDLLADDLDVLTVTGSTDLSFGNDLGTTDPVDSVVASSFTGDLTVAFDGQGDSVLIESGSGDDDLGGSDTNDVIDGGDGDDTITGNDGDDSLTGGDGADEFVFEATAAANGNDDIEDFTEGDDALNLSAFATDDDIAGTLSDTSTGDQVVADNEIWVITDADGSTDTAAEIAAFFGGAGTVFDAGIAGMDLVLLVRDTQAGGSTTIWYIDDGDANTIVAVGEVAQVATLVDYNGGIGDDEIVD